MQRARRFGVPFGILAGPVCALAVVSRQVVAGNPLDWGFPLEPEVGSMVVVVLQEGCEGFSALV